MDPAATVADVLRHIERCRKKNGRGPTHPKQFGRGARVEGTSGDGVVLVTVATEGHAWRLRVFAAAARLRVEVLVNPKIAEG